MQSSLRGFATVGENLILSIVRRRGEGLQQHCQKQDGLMKAGIWQRSKQGWSLGELRALWAW